MREGLPCSIQTARMNSHFPGSKSETNFPKRSAFETSILIALVLIALAAACLLGG